MMYRNLSSIASIMLLILLPHFSNGRVGMGLGESDLQAQHQGEDELWEAQFIAERSAIVSVFHDSNSTYMCGICIIGDL